MVNPTVTPERVKELARAKALRLVASHKYSHANFATLLAWTKVAMERHLGRTRDVGRFQRSNPTWILKEAREASVDDRLCAISHRRDIAVLCFLACQEQEAVDAFRELSRDQPDDFEIVELLVSAMAGPQFQAESTLIFQSLISEPGRSHAHRALGHAGLGGSRLQRGRHAEALPHFQRALVECRAAEDSKGEAGMLVNIGICSLALSEPREAHAAFVEATNILKSADASDLRGMAQVHAALTAYQLERFLEAERYARDSLEGLRAVKLHTLVSLALTLLGLSMLNRVDADHKECAKCFAESEKIALRSRDREAAEIAVLGARRLALFRGDPVLASALGNRGLRLGGGQPTDAQVADQLRSEALAYERTGDLRKARTSGERALAIDERLGDRFRQATCHLILCRVAITARERTIARNHLVAAEALLEASHHDHAEFLLEKLEEWRQKIFREGPSL